MDDTDRLADSLMPFFLESAGNLDYRNISDSYPRLSKNEQYVLPLIYFDSQVNNGRIHQFLLNSTGVLFPYVWEVAKALQIELLDRLCHRLVLIDANFMKCHAELSPSDTEEFLRPHHAFLDSFDKEYEEEIRPEMFKKLTDYINNQTE